MHETSTKNHLKLNIIRNKIVVRIIRKDNSPVSSMVDELSGGSMMFSSTKAETNRCVKEPKGVLSSGSLETKFRFNVSNKMMLY